MNTPLQNSADRTLEIQKMNAEQRQRLALRRSQRLWTAVEQIIEMKPPQVPVEKAKPAVAPILPKTPLAQEKTMPWEPVKAGIEKQDVVSQEIDKIEKELEEAVIQSALAELEKMKPEEKREIVQNMAKQEENWETLHPQDIKIPEKEVNMWWNLLKMSRKEDFKPVSILYGLEKGEIGKLDIEWFKIFEIVKIRAQNKGAYAMSVIRFQTHSMTKPLEENYMITIPLIKGVAISILNHHTMTTVRTYSVKGVWKSEKSLSFIGKFLNLFSR